MRKYGHSDGNSSCNIQDVSWHNIIMDVLGGHSKDAEKSIKCLIGVRSQRVFFIVVITLFLRLISFFVACSLACLVSVFLSFGTSVSLHVIYTFSFLVLHNLVFQYINLCFLPFGSLLFSVKSKSRYAQLAVRQSKFASSSLSYRWYNFMVVTMYKYHRFRHSYQKSFRLIHSIVFYRFPACCFT